MVEFTRIRPGLFTFFQLAKLWGAPLQDFLIPSDRPFSRSRPFGKLLISLMSRWLDRVFMPRQAQLQLQFILIMDGIIRRAASIVDARRIIATFLMCSVVESMSQSIPADEPRYIPLDDRQRTAIKAFVSACQKVRDDVYGNVHFVLTETHIIKNAQGTARDVTEIEYWSRDNKYFRMDTKIVESSNSSKVGMRYRMVLAPNGYISLGAESENAPLVIRNWGSFEEGWDLFGGNFFVQAAARSGGIARADATLGKRLAAEIGDAALQVVAVDIEPSKIVLSPDGFRLEIESLWQSPPNTTQSTTVRDVAHGVAVHYESSNSTNGVFTFSSLSDKNYDFTRFGCIPSYQLEKVAKASGNAHSHEYKTQSVSWDPVPLDVFSLEAQGIGSLKPESVWRRRACTMLAGLLLLVVYIVAKRIQARATKFA